MKINTDQIHALMQKQSQKPSSQKKASGFKDLLMQEMQESHPSVSSSEMDKTVSLSQPGSIGTTALLQNKAIESLNNQQETMDTIHGVLDQWGSYVEKLGSPKISLRSVYNDLQDLTQKVSALKETLLCSQGKTSPELDALCNEMDVLATTENFKLNRGDYSA